jgi:maleylacetate reductase
MTAIGPFVFPGLRSRVIFGFGTIAQTFAEIEKLGRARSLVCRRRTRRRMRRCLLSGWRALRLRFRQRRHVYAGPHHRVRPCDFHERRADCLVALGRGLTTGLGKAIAVRTEAEEVVIPTA